MDDIELRNRHKKKRHEHVGGDRIKGQQTLEQWIRETVNLEKFFFFLFFFFLNLPVVSVEIRTSHLLGKCSTT
jgi:hypothetical protein